MRQYARAARFYGWTHEYMMRMRVRVFRAYFEQIEPLEAYEQTHRLVVASSINTTPEARKELFDEYSATAMEKKKEEPLLLTDPGDIRRWFDAHG